MTADAPQIRIVEAPPPPPPPASARLEDKLQRLPWKIAVGIVLAGGLLLGIRALIVGRAPQPEPPPVVLAKDPPPLPPAPAPPTVAPEPPPKPPVVPPPAEAPAPPKEPPKADPPKAPPKEEPATPPAEPPKKPEPPPAPAPAPAKDLVGHWSFDEGSGADVADASSSGNGGTLIGQGTRWIKGRVGGALQFDGKGGYVSCGLSRIPNPSQAQTLSFWYRIDHVPTKDEILISITNDAQKSGLEASLRHGKFMISAWGGGELVGAPLPAMNEWHHYAYTFDGTTHVLHVDGKETDRARMAASTHPPSRLQFGRWTGGLNPFNGGLDEVRLYSRVLSAQEISALASPALPEEKPADASGLVDLLKLIDPARDSVKGQWTFAEGALVSPAVPWCRLQIPYAPPEEYDLTLVATRTVGLESVNIGLVGGGRQFLALLDGWNGTKSGIDMVDGRNASENETTIFRQTFTNNQKATVLCSVRKDSVRVTVDGNVIIDWKAGFDRLSLFPPWRVNSSQALALGCYDCVWRFDSITLRPVTGTGRSLVPAADAPGREAENPANAATNGVAVEFYDGATGTRLPDFSTLRLTNKTTFQVFNMSGAGGRLACYRFSGYLMVPESGEYTFFLNSIDASRLFIGGDEVVNNDFGHPLQEKTGKLLLKAGKHAIVVEYYSFSPNLRLEVLWEGPGMPKGMIRKESLFTTGVPLPVAKKPVPPAEPPKSREERIEQFKKDLLSKDEPVRVAALQSAVRDKGVRALLARRLETDTDAVRIAAAQALALQKHPEAAAALGRGLTVNQKNEGVTKAILAALGELGMCACLPALETAITLQNGAFGIEALGHISRIGCPEAAPGLVKLRRSAEEDYQKHISAQARTGATVVPTTPNPKYPLAHLYSPLVTTLYRLMGSSTTQAELEKSIKKGEHLQNLVSTFYCEESDKTFDVTVGPPRSCPLAPAVKSHGDILLKHRKP